MGPIVSAFEDAPCVGRSWLWDSTHQADHREAAALCKTCPALNPCADLLREELSGSRTMQVAGGGPVGTWAGRLVGKGFKWTPNPREHGTDRGYHQHRHYGEQSCDECLAAHATRVRESARAS